MGCRCKDRQTILGQAVRSAMQGNVRRAAQRISLVARSTAGDAAAMRAQMQARLQARTIKR